MPNQTKKLASYLVASDAAHKTSLDAYSECPAKAFLSYVCDAHDAFVHCENKFTKKLDGSYNKDSEESLRHISCSLLGTIMGHFETYQKTLFAGLVERSGYLAGFNPENFLGSFEKSLAISPVRLMAFRKLNAPVGLLIADSLPSWHDPSRVTSYFKAVLPKANCFSNKDQEDLLVLWQLRHSIVHTGAWLTLPDAQKVQALSSWGGKPIVFEKPFLNAVARRLHQVVKATNSTLQMAATRVIAAPWQREASASFTAFLKVTSAKSNWLA